MKNKKNTPYKGSHEPKKKALNPFEVHVNRQKYNILGKSSKAEKGLPGVSRSRAINKRKSTLFQEYALKGKNNKFFDRRIGERDSAMTTDDKVMARYTAERIRYHSKKSLYNLGDNEVLTHGGESLEEIEKFEDPRSDDDDDPDINESKGGKLKEDFVSEAHFGGGMLKKLDGDSKNRKDLIDQMIIESKQRKAEKQKLREETLDLTDKLDSEWKDVLPLMGSSKKGKNDSEVEVKSDRTYSSYDKLSKELIFEPRGMATDKLKSPEELAKEERIKLDELERARILRMQGDDVQSKKVTHRSADDLDDGFDFSGEDVPRKVKNKVAEDAEETSTSMTANSPANSKLEAQSVTDSEESEADATSDDEESSDSDSDDFSDFKSSADERDDNYPEKSKTITMEKPTQMQTNSLTDLPFTLPIHKSYEEFEQFIKKHPSKLGIIIERMVKTNHPCVKDGSRDKMVTLYKYLLQHLQDTASDSSTTRSTFQVLDILAPWFFDIAQLVPVTTTTAMCDVIREKYDEFSKKSKKFPSLETLVFLKLVSILFTTSDFRHRLVSPTLVFMQHMLSSCAVRSSSDVATGLFITTLIYEYTSLSRRFTPEAINFLRKILLAAQIPHSSYWTKPSQSKTFLLHVPPSFCCPPDLKPLSRYDFFGEHFLVNFKIRAIKLALQLLEKFCDFSDDSSTFLIFEPFVPLLDPEAYCEILREQVRLTLSKISGLKEKKLYKLMAERKRPKALKLYEPKIEEVYTFKKKRSVTREKDEHEKLLHKYKKEAKGALREIRRDNTFLAKLKINETKASDLERRRKVKEIFGDAANQAGELRKMKRAKT